MITTINKYSESIKREKEISDSRYQREAERRDESNLKLTENEKLKHIRQALDESIKNGSPFKGVLNRGWDSSLVLKVLQERRLGQETSENKSRLENKLDEAKTGMEAKLYTGGGGLRQVRRAFTNPEPVTAVQKVQNQEPSGSGLLLLTSPVLLMQASACGNVSQVEKALKRYHVDARGPDDVTALMAAARAGRFEILVLLAKKEASVNLVDSYGRTALDHALMEHKLDHKCVRWLREQRAHTSQELKEMIEEEKAKIWRYEEHMKSLEKQLAKYDELGKNATPERASQSPRPQTTTAAKTNLGMLNPFSPDEHNRWNITS